MKTLTPIQLTDRPTAEQVIFTTDDYTVELCRSRACLNTAFRLRYRAYLGVEAIEANEEELLYDDYDFDPNCFVHLVWYQGKPVATVRGCIYADRYDWHPTEAITYFPQDVEEQLGRRARLLESNRYAVDPDFQGRKSLFAQMLMFRAHALNAYTHGCTYIITAVRANHLPFYRRFLGMERISTGTNFVSWADADVVLLATTTDDCLAMAIRRGMPDIDADAVQRYADCAGISIVAMPLCIAA